MSYAVKRIGLFLATSSFVVSGPFKEEPLRRVFAPATLGGEATINSLAQSTSQIIAGGNHVSYYENGRWETLPEPSKSVIRGLVVDGDTLWVLSPGEVGHMSLPLTKKTQYISLEIPGLKGAGDLWQLVKAGSDLVANSSEAVWIIDPQSGASRDFPLPNKYRTVLVPFDNHLVISQPNVGLWEVKNGQLIPFENPLSDRRDTAWLWSDSSYLLTATKLYERIDGEFREKLPFTSLNRSVVTSVTKWDRWLALASFTKGMVLLNPETGDTVTHEQLPSEPARGALSTLVDSAGHLWVGTNSGIEMFESLRFGHRIVLSANPLAAVRQQGLAISFDDHTDYFPTNGKEEHFDRAYALLPTRFGLGRGGWGKVTFGEKSIPTPVNLVNDLKEVSDGSVLAIAGQEKIYLVDPAKATSTLILETKSEVRATAANAEGLWIITSNRSLLRSEISKPTNFVEIGKIPGSVPYSLRFLGSVPIFTSDDVVRFGFDYKPIASTAGLKHARLAETSGKLWLAGEQDGVERLGQLKYIDGKVVWETVEAKGLSSLSEIHSFSANEGVLTFCGDSTILELNAAALAPAYRLEPPALTFSVQDRSNRQITSSDRPPATLTAETNRVTFLGTTTFDEFGEKPSFERRLLPTESAWTPTKPGESVTYPSLSARTYQLEIRSTHLGKTGQTKTYTFEVLPPWYASKFAIAGYVVLAAAAAYLGYRLRTRQILRRNQELERLIEIRTRDLAKASAAKTEFLASMSHEIRNPMNGVVGLVNILRDQALGNPRQMHTLKMLSSCADQLRSTVDDILDFSKIEAGKVGLETSTFNLLDTLDASAATIDPSGNTIRFLDRPRADLLLSGDAAKLRQIFANYLSNALKYGVPPEARVSTILSPKTDGIQLTLSVTSSGPTIDKDTLDKFFDSFTRGDEAMERNIRGTGLGLAICRRYAQAMGGDVGAVSNNGETTFYLTVPFELVGEEAPVVVTPVVPSSALPAKALAIEDEDYNRVVLGSILAKMNYTVDWATTGREALQLARENGYDIILTDYRLPDTNGVELTKEILRLCTDPKPAVFAVTAYSTRERRQECLEAGMSGFISKPITLEKLRTTLANWGEKNMAKISLETSRPRVPPKVPAEVENSWNELRNLIPADPKDAAELAHKLNNLCRSHYLFDLAEQLELLEGALERGDATEKFVSAIERLFPAIAVGPRL